MAFDTRPVPPNYPAPATARGNVSNSNEPKAPHTARTFVPSASQDSNALLPTGTAEAQKNDFKVKFSAINSIFDHLEAELNQMSQTVDWSPEKVMIAEMMRLRMKRLARRTEIVCGLEKDWRDERNSRSNDQNKKVIKNSELQQQVAALREQLNQANAKIEKLSEMEASYQKMRRGQTRMNSNESNSLFLPHVDASPLERDSLPGLVEECSEGASSNPDRLTTNVLFPSKISEEKLQQRSSNKDIKRPSGTLQSEEQISLQNIEDFYTALNSDLKLEEVIDLIQCEVREQVAIMCGLKEDESYVTRVSRITKKDQDLLIGDRVAVRLYIHDASGPSLWYQGIDTRIAVKMESSNAGKAVQTKEPYFEDENGLVRIYYPLLNRDHKVLAVCDVKIPAFAEEKLNYHGQFTKTLTQITVALERSIEFLYLEEAQLRFQKLYRYIVPLFSLCDDMRALMWSLSENCTELLSCEKVHIFVVDMNRDWIYTYLTGMQEQTFPLRDSDNVACHVALTGTSVNLPDCRKQKRFRVEFTGETHPETCLVTPIFNSRTDSVFGVMVAINKKGKAAFNKNDQDVAESFQEVCWVSMSLAVERQSHTKAIEAIVEQRNNLLANIKDVQKAKKKMARLCQLLTTVAACVDPLTVIYRFLSGATDAFGVSEVKFFAFAPETGILMTDKGALDIGALPQSSTAEKYKNGCLVECVQMQQPVHITDVGINGKIKKDWDIPLGYTQQDAAELLFVPLLSTLREAGPQRMKDVQGVFRLVSKEKGVLDHYMPRTMTAVCTLLQHLCDRGKKLEAAAQNTNSYKDIYSAQGTRNLFRAVTTAAKKQLRASRVYLLVADSTNETLWSLVGPNFDQKVEISQQGNNIEHHIFHVGAVINIGQITKPTLDQSLGFSPKVLMGFPIRGEKLNSKQTTDPTDTNHGNKNNKGKESSHVKSGSATIFDKNNEREIIGVLIAVDKIGMVQFDQVDETHAMPLAAATAVGLKHALASLKKTQECRQSHLYVNAIVSLLKASHLGEFRTTLDSLLSRIVDCDEVTTFILNAAHDELHIIGEDPACAWINPEAANRSMDGDATPIDTKGNADSQVQKEVIQVGRVPYIDEALKGQIHWPRDVYLDKNHVVTTSDSDREWKVFCVVPVCMASGRILGVIRFLHKNSSDHTFYDRSFTDHIALFTSACAEVYFTLSQRPIPKTWLDQRLLDTDRILMMTHPDGRLKRCHGSIVTVLGKGDTMCRQIPCWEWLPESDIWQSTMKQIFFGNTMEHTPTISSLHVKNFYWMNKGKLMYGDLYIVPLFSQPHRRTCTMVECYISLANVQALPGCVISPVYFKKEIKRESNIEAVRPKVGFANAGDSPPRLQGSMIKKKEDDFGIGGEENKPKIPLAQNYVLRDVFLIGVSFANKVVTQKKKNAENSDHIPGRSSVMLNNKPVEEKKDDPINSAFSAIHCDTEMSTLMLKTFELVHQFRGNVYFFERQGVYIMFNSHADALLAGSCLEQSLGSICTELGFDICIVCMHAVLNTDAELITAAGTRVEEVEPFYLNRVKTSIMSNQKNSNRDKRIPHKAIHSLYEDENERANSGYSHVQLEEIPDPLKILEVPQDVHLNLKTLMQRASSYSFQGFFCYTVPTEFNADYILIPVEQLLLVEKIVQGKTLVPIERRQTLFAVYGRFRDLPKSLLQRVARFNVAFRAYKNENTLLMAINEFTSLIAGAKDNPEQARLENNATPQLTICLRRALWLYLSESKDWNGVWTKDTEPNLAELRELLKNFFHNDEPWLRQFCGKSLDLLEKLLQDDNS